MLIVADEVADDLVLEVLLLGPQVVNAVPNLFQIPPALPPIGQYSFPDLREDLTNGKFPSNNFLGNRTIKLYL